MVPVGSLVKFQSQGEKRAVFTNFQRCVIVTKQALNFAKNQALTSKNLVFSMVSWRLSSAG